MERILMIAMLCALAVPAHAEGTAAEDAGPVMVEVPAEPVLPSVDVPFYVPLTEEQQELPMAAGAEEFDYAPGVEVPSTPPASKVYVDRVP